MKDHEGSIRNAGMREQTCVAACVLKLIKLGRRLITVVCPLLLLVLVGGCAGVSNVIGTDFAPLPPATPRELLERLKVLWSDENVRDVVFVERLTGIRLDYKPDRIVADRMWARRLLSDSQGAVREIEAAYVPVQRVSLSLYFNPASFCVEPQIVETVLGQPTGYGFPPRPHGAPIPFPQPGENGPWSIQYTEVRETRVFAFVFEFKNCAKELHLVRNKPTVRE